MSAHKSNQKAINVLDNFMSKTIILTVKEESIGCSVAYILADKRHPNNTYNNLQHRHQGRRGKNWSQYLGKRTRYLPEELHLKN